MLRCSRLSLPAACSLALRSDAAAAPAPDRGGDGDGDAGAAVVPLSTFMLEWVVG